MDLWQGVAGLSARVGELLTERDNWRDTANQHRAALDVLQAKLDRADAVVGAARLERQAHAALPAVPHGEPHEAWVTAHRALHAAVDALDGVPRRDSGGGA